MRYKDSQDWLELAAAACDHAGIDPGSIEPITTWDQKFTDSDWYRNNAVFRLGGQRCLKIYGPTSARQFHVERSVLHTLTNQASIPAPRIITAADASHLPPYLIMSEVAGVTLEDLWKSLTRSELLAIAREIGTMTAAIHQLPQEELAEVERRFGGRSEYIKEMQTERIEEIEAIKALSVSQRDDLLDYLLGEALEILDDLPKVTHSDFSHAHIYLARDSGTLQVSGFIDWGEAMIGPPEWDIAFHWFWTFSGDREAMRECLKTFYPGGQTPERFARRCLATHLYSFSMRELWPQFDNKAGWSGSIVHALTESLFPPEVFGPPD